MYFRHNEDGLKNKMAALNDFRNCHKDITFPCGVHLTKFKLYVFPHTAMGLQPPGERFGLSDSHFP